MVNSLPDVDRGDVLSLCGVKKRFGSREVLAGIDLNLKAGQCLALLGPNGAGKSTTIRIALGLSRADEGEIRVLNFNMPEQGDLARAQIGVVPQYDALDPDFNVMENLLVFGGFFGIPSAVLRERAGQLVEFAALGQRLTQSVSQLSGGMKRRLSLARALINAPQLLFLDEPTTALDPQAKHLIWERLLQLKRQGISLFLTTHFMDEAQRLADQVAVLDQGRIIEAGTPSELIARHVGRVVLEMWGAGAPAYLDGLSQRGIVSAAQTERRGESFYLGGAQADVVFDQLKQDGPFEVEFLLRPGNLEDVFFRLTGRDLRED